MNERTVELYKQATEFAYNSIGREHANTAYFQGAITGKFAELIVRECMRQVEEQYKPVLEDETMMKDTHWDGYVQCGVDSYVAIKEHFGVEE